MFLLSRVNNVLLTETLESKGLGGLRPDLDLGQRIISRDLNPGEHAFDDPTFRLNLGLPNTSQMFLPLRHQDS